MIKNKKKAPSSVSLMVCLKHFNNNAFSYLNLSIKPKIKGCGPTENRTRDFCVSDKCFTIKLLAHNNNNMKLNYLKLSA